MECQFSRWLSLNVRIFKMVLFGNELPVISFESAFFVVKGGQQKHLTQICVPYFSALVHQISFRRISYFSLLILYQNVFEDMMQIN